MRPFAWFAVFITLVSLAPEVSAQPPQDRRQVTLTENIRVAMSPLWRLSNQTRDSMQYYVPLAKDRPQEPQSPRESDQDVKPQYMALYEAGLVITTERRRDHAEAVRRLAEIASEQAEPSTYLVIGGWPAIERRYR